MKIIFVLLNLAVIFCGCSIKPILTPEVIKKNQLCESYCNGSTESLQLFFSNWHDEIPPLTDALRMNISDTLKVVYKVYEDFCNYHLEASSNFYSKSPYCMAQNKIVYKFSNDAHLNFELSKLDIVLKNTLNDFRPLPGKLKAKIVYTSPSYEAILNAFVHDSCGRGWQTKYQNGPWDWSHANFLEKVVPLRASLMGFYFCTLPFVNLLFNKGMSEVIIEWNIGYTGRSDLFILSDGKWKYQNSSGTWIE